MRGYEASEERDGFIKYFDKLMTLARFSTYFAFLVIIVAHTVVGTNISASCKVFRKFFQMKFGSATLPSLTEVILPYGASSSPIFVGFFLGFVFTTSLWFLEKNDQGRRYLPLGIAVALIACLMHIAVVFMGLTMPFVMINNGIITGFVHE